MGRPFFFPFLSFSLVYNASSDHACRYMRPCYDHNSRMHTPISHSRGEHRAVLVALRLCPTGMLHSGHQADGGMASLACTRALNYPSLFDGLSLSSGAIVKHTNTRATACFFAAVCSMVIDLTLPTAPMLAVLHGRTHQTSAVFPIYPLIPLGPFCRRVTPFVLVFCCAFDSAMHMHPLIDSVLGSGFGSLGWFASQCSLVMVLTCGLSANLASYYQFHSLMRCWCMPPHFHRCDI